MNSDPYHLGSSRVGQQGSLLHTAAPSVSFETLQSEYAGISNCFIHSEKDLD